MSYQNPSIADFKSYYPRDFPFQPDDVDPDLDKYIQDADIEKAFGQTDININQAQWDSQGAYAIGYNLLAAHYMVIDLRMASQGIRGQYSWMEQSKSVGSVSASYAIPQRILDDPYFAMLTQTNYGAKYLQLLLPRLSGQVFIVAGRTTP